MINNVNYKQYTGGGGDICPDGSNVVVYSSKKYCKAYRANITWQIPTTRANNTPLSLSELKGYEIYWVRSSDNAKGTFGVGGGSKTTSVFDVYTPGVYSFSIKAIDVNGLKSVPSESISVYLGN